MKKNISKKKIRWKWKDLFLLRLSWLDAWLDVATRSTTGVGEWERERKTERNRQRDLEAEWKKVSCNTERDGWKGNLNRSFNSLRHSWKWANPGIFKFFSPTIPLESNSGHFDICWYLPTTHWPFLFPLIFRDLSFNSSSVIFLFLLMFFSLSHWFPSLYLSLDLFPPLSLPLLSFTVFSFFFFYWSLSLHFCNDFLSLHSPKLEKSNLKFSQLRLFRDRISLLAKNR